MSTATDGPSYRGALSVLLLIALAAFVVAVFHDGFRSLVAMWRYSSYNHGYLVPLVSLFILVSERSQLRWLEWNGSLAGLAVLAPAVLMWLVGRATSIQAIEHVALACLLVAFLWTIAGDRLIAVAWFPLLYLFLAVPVGESVVPYLQTVTADVATLALNVFGVAAYREGWFISLPGGDFEVAKACSGFRYLNAGIAMAALIAYLVLRSPWIRLGYVALIGALFIVVNGVRAFLVMWIASASEMRYMTGEDHVVLGYALFLAIAVFAYWLAGRLAGYGAQRRAQVP